jgi:hypothetical protein
MPYFKDGKVRTIILALLIILLVSISALPGCKGEKPTPDANESQAPQPEQPKQPEQPEQPKQPEDIAAAEKAAVEAAEAWLNILDSGEYVKSRDEAAAYFRNTVTKEQWEASLEPIRKRLGKLISRKVLSKKYVTDIPNAPPGKYVIIQFQARFQNRTSAVETVTPMLEKDGKWRVSGYYVK